MKERPPFGTFPILWQRKTGTMTEVHDSSKSFYSSIIPITSAHIYWAKEVMDKTEVNNLGNLVFPQEK